MKNPALENATDTPRTMELYVRMRSDGDEWTTEDVEKIFDHARQLERELNAALKPPPCLHTRQSGWIKGDKSEMHCQDCGKQMTPQAITGGTLFLAGKGY